VKTSLLAIAVLLVPLLVGGDLAAANGAVQKPSPTAAGTPGAPRNPGTYEVLDRYATLCNKTLLLAAALPSLPKSITDSLPTETTNAIARIESELARNGIEVIEDGPHFVRLVPAEFRDSFTNLPLRGAELAAKAASEKAAGEKLQPGMIDFRNADVEQVLDVCSVMIGRTLVRSASLPGANIRLRTLGAISMEEAVYGLKTSLALNGIAIVNDGLKFALVVPLAGATRVKTEAPKPDTGAKLYAPEEIPRIGIGILLSPTPRTSQIPITEELDQIRRPAGRLLEFYATLVDKTAEPSETLDGSRLRFRVTTPLTRAELIYAIQKTFSLNGLAIVSNDEKTVCLARMSEPSTGKER